MPAHKTLIFHIGDHKTGSTSIQNAFAEGRVSLDQKTFLYPAQLASNVLKKHFLNWAEAPDGPQKNKAARPLAALADRIKTADVDYVVVSAEELEWVPIDIFKQVVDHFFAAAADEIRIIAYVRPHAPRIVSSYCEYTKIGLPHTLKQDLVQFTHDSAKTDVFTYHGRFQHWRSLYGDAFLLRPMVRSALVNGSVVADFLTHAFPGDSYQLQDDVMSNESLDLVDLMRLKVLQSNLLDQSPRLRHQVGWDFLHQTSQMSPPSKRQKLQFHRALAKEIRTFYLEDARAVDRDFFDGKPLLETDLDKTIRKAPRRKQPVDPRHYLTDSEIRSLEIMSRFITDMFAIEDVNWPMFFHKKSIAKVQAIRARYIPPETEG